LNFRGAFAYTTKILRAGFAHTPCRPYLFKLNPRKWYFRDKTPRLRHRFGWYFALLKVCQKCDLQNSRSIA
jgi:hypothetical protein